MTMDQAPAAPDESAAGSGGRPPFDTSVANQARIYDYLLGGKDNYAADRAAVDEVLKLAPEMGFTARANRAFLGRVVRYLTAEAGIRQFLDIGTGIPTAGNTHQVAQAIAPESRVVYVDYDPVVLAHARALLTSHEAGATEYIDADLRDTDKILGPAARLLDFTKPVAVTLLMILHVIPDSDDPPALVARVMDAMPSGSYLALSHLGAELLDQEKQQGFQERCAPLGAAAVHRPHPRADGTVLRGHGPGGARGRAGRGMAPRPRRRGRDGQVGPVVRARPEALR